MNSKDHLHLRPLSALFAVIGCVCILGLTGCVTQNAAKKFAEFEKLGITEAQITGKFSNTEYRVVRGDGIRRAVFQHSNAWLPKVLIVRETKEEPKP